MKAVDARGYKLKTYLQRRHSRIGHEPDCSKAHTETRCRTGSSTHACKGSTANRTLSASNGGSNSVLVKGRLSVGLALAMR